MAYTNKVKITDRASISPLWNGSDITILATKFNIGGNNIVSAADKTMQTTTLTTADTDAGDVGSSYINNFNRRKGNVSYAGFVNQTIKITAVFDEDQLSNITILENVSTKIWTPSKLYELVLKPRTVYLKDQVLVDLLSSLQDTSPAVYNTYGIPAILKDWSITPNLNNNQITMEMTFTEDKEIS